MGANWQHPRSAQGSKQAPFWMGYMQQPQTLHAYWISEKLQPAPARQVQHDRPVPPSTSALVDQPVQQRETDAHQKTPELQHEADVAEEPGDAAVAADLLQQRQRAQQQQHQQLISPTASDASDIKLDVSSIEHEANTDMGTAINDNTANLQPRTTDCADAAEPNSNGATSVGNAGMGLLQETDTPGSNRAEPSPSSPHMGVQSSHKCNADDSASASAHEETAASSSHAVEVSSAQSAHAALQHSDHSREAALQLPAQTVRPASVMQQHSRLREHRLGIAHSKHDEPKQDARGTLTAQERYRLLWL